MYENFKITTKLNGFLEFSEFFNKTILFYMLIKICIVSLKQLNHPNFYLMFAEEKHWKQLKDDKIVSDDEVEPGLLKFVNLRLLLVIIY